MEHSLHNRPSDQDLYYHIMIISSNKNVLEISHPSDKRPKVEPGGGDEEKDEDEDGWSCLSHHSLAAPRVPCKNSDVCVADFAF